MKRYVKPLLVFGVLVIVLAVASWLAFPAWRNAPGGALGLLGVVILALLAVIKDAVGILKELKEITGEEKEVGVKEPAGPTRQVTASGERSVAVGGDLSGTVITGDNYDGTAKKKKNV